MNDAQKTIAELIETLQTLELAARHRNDTTGNPCRWLECKAFARAANEARDLILRLTHTSNTPELLEALKGTIEAGREYAERHVSNRYFMSDPRIKRALEILNKFNGL